MVNAAVFGLVVVALLTAADDYCGEDENYWSTSYDDAHQFSCPDLLHQGMTFFESCHAGKYEDRVWNYGCSDINVTFSYFEDTELTAYDEPWTLLCPNGVVTGLFSEEDDHYEDRNGAMVFELCFAVAVGWEGQESY